MKHAMSDTINELKHTTLLSVTNKILVALVLGFSLAALASPATAQQSDPRDAAINRCLAEAQKAFPAADQDIQRAEAYRACMVKAGFYP